MRLRSFAFAAVLGIAILAGCVKTGSVVEQQPLATGVLRNKTVAIVVNAKDPDWQTDAGKFKEGLFAALGEIGWKYSEKPDVVFEATWTEFDKGSKGARMFNVGGEAELHMDLVIHTPDGAVIAKLGITGNSKRQSRTKVGGYDTSWGDSLPDRAVRAAIEQISEYLKDHA